MRLSEKKGQALYEALAEPLMVLRVDFQRDKSINIDEKLFMLQFQIWDNIKNVLNIKE